jgi:RNA 2',3'-cyclic 3'-phosphodiesterase
LIQGAAVRLFIAIAIPDSIRDAFANFLREMHAAVPDVKFVRPENLHVTLKFLGNTPPERLEALCNALSAIRSSPVSLGLHGLGAFPNERRASVLWAGIIGPPNLASLASDVDRAAHSLGFPLETRRFAPHLTLARLNAPGLPSKLAQLAADNARRSFGSFTIAEFHLIESKLKSSGAEYTTLRTFSFAEA